MKSYSKPGDSCGTVALIVFFIALLATILKKRIRKQVSDLKNTKRVSSDLLTREI
jgi:hypothetical protein